MRCFIPCIEITILLKGSITGRKITLEYGALTWLALQVNEAPMVLHDLFADGQAHTGTFCIMAIQPLENTKDLFVVNRVDTGAIIANRNTIIIAIIFSESRRQLI